MTWARMAVASTLLVVFAAGCGYNLGYRAPPSVTTVAVPIFDNDTLPLRREIEYDLTSAFRKEIQSRTDLVLVDQSGADMVVYGTVRDFREIVVAEGRVDEKTESSIFITVELTVEDYANQKRRFERVHASEPLSIERGETLEVARARAIGNLAERMLTALEDWPQDEP